MLVLTYVYRIRPTAAQHAQLSKILNDQRQFYNAALEERIGAWRRGVSISLNDQTKSLTEIRSFEPDHGEIPYNVSKWTLKRLDDAMKAFFRRAKQRGGKAGFPRFRSASRWSSFGFHQKGGLRLRGRKLLFSGGIAGGLDLKLHRPLPSEGVIKSATFTKEGRHWRVGLTVSTPAPSNHPSPTTVCGIDVGVEALATLDKGARIENIRPRKSRQQDLCRASRALSRCKRGSRRRQKVRARLAAAQRRVRNTRATYLHQVSATIARDHALIAVEDLNLKNMTRSARGTAAQPGTNVAANRWV
jgi:putative transposase